ncbi:hypothetical protein [Mameliella alba]|uniref:Uncharacterized protein n=1 Tax=Mameliella alba TaxID=561184 RepID=A0A0B3RR56_9RHOB|nr:hypothetical protein [Mameliella alba]KHQ53595.1 hypothetical protein OA50_01582 [Mameliella alba]
MSGLVHADQPIDAQDWEQVEYILVLTLFIMEGKEDEFHFLELFVDLIHRRLLWDRDDENTVGAVAIFADRFPIIHRGDGKILWGEQEDALTFSTARIFWDELYLVDLARRRAARPDRRRAKDGELYMDHGV